MGWISNTTRLSFSFFWARSSFSISKLHAYLGLRLGSGCDLRLLRVTECKPVASSRLAEGHARNCAVRHRSWRWLLSTDVSDLDLLGSQEVNSQIYLFIYFFVNLPNTPIPSLLHFPPKSNPTHLGDRKFVLSNSLQNPIQSNPTYSINLYL